jgi:hypothetical protein
MLTQRFMSSLVSAKRCRQKNGVCSRNLGAHSGKVTGDEVRMRERERKTNTKARKRHLVSDCL